MIQVREGTDYKAVFLVNILTVPLAAENGFQIRIM